MSLTVRSAMELENYRCWWIVAPMAVRGADT
jgi:hypothetical protein